MHWLLLVCCVLPAFARSKLDGGEDHLLEPMMGRLFISEQIALLNSLKLVKYLIYLTVKKVEDEYPIME